MDTYCQTAVKVNFKGSGFSGQKRKGGGGSNPNQEPNYKL